MNLLLNRKQKPCSVFSLVPLRIGSGVMFSLHAELELGDDELALMEHYKLTKTALVTPPPFEDLKRSLGQALIVAIAAFIIAWFAAGFFTAVPISIVIYGVMTVVYFIAEREQIMVRDLMNGGRTFYCDSIVSLIKKEAYLEGVSAYLRQVLESSQHWHDREVVPIYALDKEQAKQVLLRSV